MLEKIVFVRRCFNFYFYNKIILYIKKYIEIKNYKILFVVLFFFIDNLFNKKKFRNIVNLLVNRFFN